MYLRANTSRSLAETGDDSHSDRPPVSVPPGVLYGLVVNALSSITGKHCFKLAGDNIFSVSLRGLATYPFGSFQLSYYHNIANQAKKKIKGITSCK